MKYRYSNLTCEWEIKVNWETIIEKVIDSDFCPIKDVTYTDIKDLEKVTNGEIISVKGKLKKGPLMK